MQSIFKSSRPLYHHGFYIITAFISAWALYQPGYDVIINGNNASDVITHLYHIAKPLYHMVQICGLSALSWYKYIYIYTAAILLWDSQTESFLLVNWLTKPKIRESHLLVVCNESVRHQARLA